MPLEQHRIRRRIDREKAMQCRGYGVNAASKSSVVLLVRGDSHMRGTTNAYGTPP